ncbi:MAG: MerR family transcriptional regulator [Lachnospiraceae bacterium]|nr:MerR family transcriptional regulator [Lachnospiraceae bacterium]
MSEIKYLISDTSKQLGVEPHVLRYWEEELDMPIKRNEMGHRYYTEDDIRVLKSVRDMKERGIQLKAIKHILKELYVNSEYDPQVLEHATVQNIVTNQQTDAIHSGAVSNGTSEAHAGMAAGGISESQIGSPAGGGAALQAIPHGEAVSVMSSELKMEQFQEIMFRIIAKALEKNNISLSGTISSEISDKVSEQVAEAVSERVSVNVTEQLTENVSERVSERVSQRVSEDVSLKVSDSVSDRVSGQVSEQVIKQMDYILRENEEREEERFRKLDEAIRQRQKANAEAAAALIEDSKKKKKHPFGKKEKRRSRLFG